MNSITNAIQRVTNPNNLGPALLATANALGTAAATVAENAAKASPFSIGASYVRADISAEKTTIPGSNENLSLAKLLKEFGMSGNRDTSEKDIPLGLRNSVGDLSDEEISAIEKDTQALTASQIQEAKKEIEGKIKAGTIVHTGGELFQSSTVKLYDTKKLEMNLKNGSPFEKQTDGSFTLKQGDKSFKFTADQFQKLLEGEEVTIGKEKDAQKFKYDSSKNELKMGENVINNHGLADISYGKSKLSGDGHETAGTMLGFLNLNADAKKRADSIDTLLSQVQQALPTDFPLKNDAHTLSLLAGTFGKRGQEGNITVDAKSLGALPNPIKEQLYADQKLRVDPSLSDLKTPEEIHKKALEVNNKSYSESALRFTFNKQDSDSQLSKLGFDPQQLSQFAGSAYAAGAELSRRLETTGSGGNSQLANEILQAAQGASSENPLKLNLSIIATAKTNTDATRAYDDSVRGADGAFGTLLSLSSGLSKDRVNDLQLVASGEDGLKKAQGQLKLLLETKDIKELIGANKIQITGLDISIYGHANEKGMLLDKTAKGDHQTLDAADANDISTNIADIANAGKVETVRMTVVGCQAGVLSKQLAKDVHTKTDGNEKANSEVIVDSTEGYAKTSGSSLNTDDVTRQFTFGADGTISGHDRWSNDGTSYHSKKSETDRIVIPSSKQEQRVTQAQTKGVGTEFTGYRSHKGDSVDDKKTNQSAGSAGGGSSNKPPENREGAGCLDPQNSPANDEWKKQTAAVS
ncbi:MAG: hypothetical protein RLZZ361_1621 [Cyanobacteriota bacterium]|jgi:hypothetical protein